MNCRPGDLAVIVGCDDVTGTYLLGRFVRVTTMNGREHWNYEGPQLETPWGDVEALLDDVLRPIRPGDIDDEEVRDLYAPKQTEAA